MSIVIKFQSDIVHDDPLKVFQDKVFLKNIKRLAQEENELFKYINDELELLDISDAKLDFELDGDSGNIFSILTYSVPRAPTEMELSTVIDQTRAQLLDGYYEEPIAVNCSEKTIYLSLIKDDHPLAPVSVEVTSDFVTANTKKCGKALENDIRKGNTTKLEAYIKKGGDVNCRDQWNQPLLFTAILSPEPAPALRLIENGADIHVRDDQGQSALFKVGYQGHLEVAKMLIAGGATVNDFENDTGMSPLMLAANRNYYDLIELFLAHNAGLGKRSVHGRSALEYTSSAKIVNLLLDAGREVYTKQDIEAALEHAIEELADVRDYQTPEIIAEHEGIVDIFRRYLTSI